VTVAAPLPDGVDQVANGACLIDGSANSGCSSTSTPAPTRLAATLTYTFVVDSNHDGLAEAGDVLEYTLTLSNPSAGTASGVDLPTALDPHLALLVGSVTTSVGAITKGNDPGATSPSVHLTALAPGDSVTVTFRATVASDLPADLLELSSQATVSASNVQPTPSDDPSTPLANDPTETPVGRASVASIPTLSGWGLSAFALLLALYPFAGRLLPERRRVPQKTPKGAGSAAGE
jgi:uncharacterized repeat protein (TIGR01451 family)